MFFSSLYFCSIYNINGGCLGDGPGDDITKLTEVSLIAAAFIAAIVVFPEMPVDKSSTTFAP